MRRTDIIGTLDATGSEFVTGSITVTDVATRIPTTNMNNRKAISVTNYSGTNWIFIGGIGVTTATGYPIQPYQGIPFDLGSGAYLYAICETGKTADVRFLEIDNA